MLPGPLDAAEARRILPGAGAALYNVWNGPWLIGSDQSSWRVVRAGGAVVVVIGCCPVPADRLCAVATRCAAGGCFDAMMELPGGFHLAVCREDDALIYGDVAGARRLFTARVGGGAAVSDRAAVLGALAGAGVDEEWLAARLCCPEMPSHLSWTELSPYARVRPVPPGHRVRMTRNAEPSARPYWQPPAARKPLCEAATELGAALSEAVAARLAEVDRATVQLSGGLDSSALAVLATATAAPVTLMTIAPRAPDNDDAWWAAHIARQVGAPHQIIEAGEYPLPFAGLPGRLPSLDEPAGFLAGPAQVEYLAEVLASAGSGAHLSGMGGDEVLLAPMSYLRGMARRRPLLAWRRVRAHAALARIPAACLARELARPLPYRRWLHAAAGKPATAGSAAALVGWEAPPSLPPWATTAAVDAFRGRLRQAAWTARPLAGTAAGHYALVRLRALARRAGLYRDTLAGLGQAVHFPYLDRAVIDACLAAAPHERTSPWRAKPLLHAALGSPSRWRATKAHYDTEIHLGLRAHRRELMELFDGSALGARHLVDDAGLRAAISTAESSRVPLAYLTETLACELWLRALPMPRTRPGLGALS